MKKIISILLTIALVFTTINISGVRADAETDTADEGQNITITVPEEGSLVGAGYIDVEFDNSMEGYTYTVYLDDEPMYWIGDDIVKTEIGEEITEDAAIKTFTSEDEGKTEVYTTTVSKHELTVKAVNGEEEIISDTRTFYVSKKGLAMGGDMSSTVEMQKLNISWYYNWAATAFNSSVDAGVAHVPMVWGVEEDNLAEISDITEDSNYILGYNEPDIESQANITPEIGLQYWPLIEATGKRTVSPAASNPNGASIWVTQFLEGTDVDAVALHCYGGIADVNRVISAVESMWNAYHKPIWVTEVSLMGRKGAVSDWSYEKEGNLEKVAEYVEALVEALDSNPHVERYAWFPYNIQSDNEIDGNDGCGATAMFDYDTGKFTELGVLYSQIGNPKGYEEYQMTEGDKYIYVEPTTVAVESIMPATTGKTVETTKSIETTTTLNVTAKKPAKVKINKAKNNKKKSVLLKWSKTSNAKKYQVQYSLSKKFKAAKKYNTKTITTKKLQYTVKKLKKTKTYYFRVRGINGKKYGAWSKVKKVKIKK